MNVFDKNNPELFNIIQSLESSGNIVKTIDPFYADGLVTDLISIFGSTITNTLMYFNLLHLESIGLGSQMVLSYIGISGTTLTAYSDLSAFTSLDVANYYNHIELNNLLCININTAPAPIYYFYTHGYFIKLNSSYNYPY